MSDDWRLDPAWSLVQWDPSYFTDQPPDQPPETAELAQPDAWANLYDGRRLVAVWSRVPSPHSPAPPTRATIVP